MTRRLTVSSSTTLAIGLVYMLLRLQHNFNSTPLQREILSSLCPHNGYILYISGHTSGGLHLLLNPSGLTMNWMITLTHIRGRTWIYYPLVGIFPQFERTSSGRLRWDWRRRYMQIYSHLYIITPLVGCKGSGRIQVLYFQWTGPNSFLLHQKRGTHHHPPPQRGDPWKNWSGVPSHSVK